ncbi:MAG: hypothetical protein Kow00123_26080 [Anaerolineales bacterium]
MANSRIMRFAETTILEVDHAQANCMHLCRIAPILRSVSPCFSNRQWKYFVTVLLAMVECKERRTLSGLLACVGEKISLCGLSRFLNRWKWSPEDVAKVWLCRFREQMGPQ